MDKITITSSYSRKLNHGLHGGNQYESSDHFCSTSIEVREGEDPAKAYEEAHDFCKDQVETKIEEEIAQLGGVSEELGGKGITEVEFGKFRNAYAKTGQIQPDMQELWEQMTYSQRKTVKHLRKFRDTTLGK